MYCEELTVAKYTELPVKEKMLIVASADRVDNIINRIKTSPDQRFIHYSSNDRMIAGIYDQVIIDGTVDNIDAYGIYDSIYPYLNQNAKEFYILRDE